MHLVVLQRQKKYHLHLFLFHEHGYAFGHKEYLKLVDGRLRLDGARAVMTDVDEETLVFRANKKNDYYLEAIDRGEFNIFEAALRKVREFHASVPRARTLRPMAP